MVFWIVTAAMILAALVLLVSALLRKRSPLSTDRGRQNVVIARERLAELKQEQAQGVLSEAQYQQSKNELEQSLLMDLEEPLLEEGSRRDSQEPSWLTIGVMVVMVPAITLGLYGYLGSPQLIEPQPQQVGHGDAGSGELPSVEAMVGALEERLNQDPNDPDGWYLLGRTYMAMKDYPKAVEAYQRLHGLVGDEPAVLLSWADAAAMQQQGDLSGTPAELVRKALALDPENSTALWLGGMVELQSGNPGLAITYWERLEPKIQDDPRASQRIASLLTQARERAGLPVDRTGEATKPPIKSVPSAGGITVRITLSPALQDNVAPEARLFVFARALQGPKMPLAAARFQAKDLPLEVTLDDSSAMMPSMKLSSFNQVVVGARISRSGDPIARSGDLTGEVSPVSVGDPATVVVVIDTLVP